MFSTVYGALLHVATASRPDIANDLNRLRVFQSGPNRLAFQSIFRIIKYLKCYLNVPLMYSRLPFGTKTLFQSHLSTTSEANRLVFPHCLCGHVDSSFTTLKESRHSITGCLETIGTVAVGWRVTKQISCATSATDAETRAYYLESKRMKQKIMFLQQLGMLLHAPFPVLSAIDQNLKTPSPIFEDNNSNLKHMGIPF